MGSPLFKHALIFEIGVECGNNSVNMREKLNSFDMLSKKKIFSCPYFDIFEEERLFPDGKVRVIITRTGVIFSVVVPVINENFVMVRQHRFGPDKISLEFPMGKVAGASPLRAAQVELKEETGYKAKLFHKIGTCTLSPSRSNTVAVVYLAEGLLPGRPEPEDGEFIEVVMVPQSEVKHKIKTSEIFDASTIAAYYFYLAHQGE